MDVDKIVREFCSAWQREDVEAIVAAFTDDAVYHNIPMEPCNGKQAIREFVEGFLATNPGGVTFEIRNQLVQGGLVMNERVDTLTIAGKKVALPVCGVFELDEQGKIRGWRDYFDMGAFSGVTA